MKNKRYIIVGDTNDAKGCLLFAIMGGKESAENVLKKLLSDPDEQDKLMIEGYTNLRVEEVEREKCWWED